MLIIDVVLHLLSTGLALAALVLVVRKRPLPPTRVERAVVEVRNELAGVLDELEKVQDLLARKNARSTMRERRESGTDPYAMRPTETPEQWKRRMRAGVQAGTIKPPRLTP